MASLSEDELQLIQGQALKLTILDLKKQALAAKQSGSVDDAYSLLKQAKRIEQEEEDTDGDDEEPPFSSTLPLFWKKVAILCKQAGDLERAKQALMNSKELESSPPPQQPSAHERSTETETIDQAEPPPEPTKQQQQENLPPPSYDSFQTFAPQGPPSYDHISKVDVTSGNDDDDHSSVDEEDAAMLAELIAGREPNDKGNTACAAPADVPLDGTETDNSNSNTMTFTDEELMDEEIMTEFRLGGAKGIPTQEEYAAKVLSYKKVALRYKQEGDIPKATKNLKIAKQLEAVATALKHMDDGLGLRIHDDAHGWMETLDPEESDLLGELMTNGSSSTKDNKNNKPAADAHSGNERLTIEDLEEMDDDNDILELVEMMGPDALPTVEELTIKITHHKQDALNHKQNGNIELAKSSLLQSKKIKLQAVRLADIYRKLEQQRTTPGTEDPQAAGVVSMEALEALVSGPPKTKEKAPQPSQGPPEDPWLLKPSSEIKAEVIRLKNEKQVQEATRMLQLFKQKLAREQQQLEDEKRSKLINTIQKRVEVSKVQRKLWQYYQWFGTESSVGRDQYQEWTAFEKECHKAIKVITTEGSEAVQLGPRVQDSTTDKTKAVAKKLYMLEDDILSLVETCTNATVATTTSTPEEGAATPANHLTINSLEVCIMGLFDMDKNEKLQKILSKQPKSNKALFQCPDLRVNAKLQLPIFPDDPSKPAFMDFEPSALSIARKEAPTTQPVSPAYEFKYDFHPSSKSCRQQVSLPRKDPKHERMLLRRMETKTAQFSVYHLHNQQKRQEAAAKKEAASQKKTSSWLFGRKATQSKSSDMDDETVGENDSKDAFLGKVRTNDVFQ